MTSISKCENAIFGILGTFMQVACPLAAAYEVIYNGYNPYQAIGVSAYTYFVGTLIKTLPVRSDDVSPGSTDPNIKKPDNTFSSAYKKALNPFRL